VGLIESLLEHIFPAAPEPLGAIRAATGRRLTARGRVVARDLIESPLTGARCVYYRYLVEEYRQASLPVGGQGLWHCVEQDEAIAEFALDDGTGRALVDPSDAVVTPAGPIAREPVDVPFNRRAWELRIGTGDLVEVQGVVEEIDDLFDGGRGYREAATRIVLRAGPAGRLRIRVLGRA
jgi:hypothetical protein